MFINIVLCHHTKYNGTFSLLLVWSPANCLFDCAQRDNCIYVCVLPITMLSVISCFVCVIYWQYLVSSCRWCLRKG